MSAAGVGYRGRRRYLGGQEADMRVNTARSLELGRRIYERYGSWEAVFKAARLRDGIYEVPAEAEALNGHAPRRAR